MGRLSKGEREGGGRFLRRFRSQILFKYTSAGININKKKQKKKLLFLERLVGLCANECLVVEVMFRVKH